MEKKVLNGECKEAIEKSRQVTKKIRMLVSFFHDVNFNKNNTLQIWLQPTTSYNFFSIFFFLT
jgi:hypothetical protein